MEELIKLGYKETQIQIFKRKRYRELYFKDDWYVVEITTKNMNQNILNYYKEILGYDQMKKEIKDIKQYDFIKSINFTPLWTHRYYTGKIYLVKKLEVL